jgi:dipeptidyl aminopeptidase/acylaminoacyl peptidase
MGSAAVASEQPARPLTMAQIASAPFPYDLSASPRDGAVAWVYNERGARNLWVAQPDSSGKYAARRLTPYTADDGNDITGLAWDGDGKTLFYTRGGDGNGRLPVNPMSLPEGPRAGTLWAVSLSGGAPRQIADGTAPSPSPNDDRVVFLRAGQPWVVRTRGDGKPQPLFIDRGQVGSLAWSPDGSRLAFVSRRRQHSIVGVYDFAGNTIRWMSPGIDSDGYPVWSPHGERIAFVRSASDRVVPFTSNPECTPWEIWVSDAATGQGKSIWRARRGVGSCFRLLFNSRDSLFWGAGDRLVFPWEGTGWVRLYSIAADGGDASLLTPGRSEVFGAQLSADRTQLVYSSNEGDLDRRHIWQLSVAGGASELNDIIGAAKYLLSLPDIDPKRLGVWGGSYGGRMSLLALAEAPQYFAAGVSYSGIYNWLTMPEFDLDRGDLSNAADMKLAYDSGPVAHMEEWRAPVLLMLGGADSIVNIEQTTALAPVLRGKHIPVDVLMIPDEVHFLLRDSSWNTVFEAMKEYFDTHLEHPMRDVAHD